MIYDPIITHYNENLTRPNAYKLCDYDYDFGSIHLYKYFKKVGIYAH